MMGRQSSEVDLVGGRAAEPAVGALTVVPVSEKGMGGRPSGVRQLVDWTGTRPATSDTGWSSRTWRTSYQGLGLEADLTAPGLGGETARVYRQSYERGLLTRIEAPGEALALLSGPSGSAGVIYDGAAQPTQLRYGNGVTQTIARDERHRVKSLSHGTGLWSSGDYVFDGAGNILSIGSDRYRYDRVQRLTRAWVAARAQGATTVNEIEWTYDPFANLQRQHRVSPAGPPAGFEIDLTFQAGGDTDGRTNKNQVTGHPAFSYTANGSLLRFTGKVGQAVGARWDEQDRLTAFVEGDPWTAGALPGEWYAYDVDGMRRLSIGTDGKPVIALRDGSGRTLAEYVEPGPTGGPQRTRDYVYGVGQLLVERA